jgi:DNA-entry nuclease
MKSASTSRARKGTWYLLLFLGLFLLTWIGTRASEAESDSVPAEAVPADWFSSLPPYTDSPYAIIHDNQPFFTDEEIREASVSYEYYSPLDSLGRCGFAMASVGQDLMPTEPRGFIGMIKPTGWHTVRYDCIEDGYLYNRCHLIAYQLSGENKISSPAPAI